MNKVRGLVIDNYDSFTYNLVEYFGEAAATRNLDLDQDIYYNDEIEISGIEDEEYDFILISPGPGTPENEEDVGITNDILRNVSQDVPTLGVCLGLEAFVYTYGGVIERAPEPIHGKSFEIYHDGKGIFEDLENPFHGARYHSLIAEEIPEEIQTTATTEHGGKELVMGVRHKDYPIEAVQFHPESILTGEKGKQNGYKMIGNFLENQGNM